MVGGREGSYNLIKKTLLWGARQEARQVQSECHKKDPIPQSSLSRDKHTMVETFHICCCSYNSTHSTSKCIWAQLITMTNTSDKPNISSRELSTLTSIKYRYK